MYTYILFKERLGLEVANKTILIYICTYNGTAYVLCIIIRIQLLSKLSSIYHIRHTVTHLTESSVVDPNSFHSDMKPEGNILLAGIQIRILSDIHNFNPKHCFKKNNLKLETWSPSVNPLTAKKFFVSDFSQSLYKHPPRYPDKRTYIRFLK